MVSFQTIWHRLHRPIRLEWVTLAVAAYFVTILNLPFWRALFTAVAPSRTYDWMFIAASFAALLALFNLALTILGTRFTFKPLVILLLPVTAAVGYFMWEYGVVIDANMVQNAFETDAREVGDLLSMGMIAAVTIGGLLPAVLLWRLPIAYRPFLKEAAAKVPVCLFSAAAAGAAILAFFMDFTSVFREQKDLRLTLLPTSYIAAVQKYGNKKLKRTPAAAKAFATDAKRGPAWTIPTRRSVTVLVIGETARAANFSLNGYPRETNPRLAKIPGLINFPNVMSCGTDTAQSVPCLFSGAGRAHTSSDISLRREGLLDILKRSGFDVLWRENQSGCKGVCARVPTENLTSSKLPAFFNNGESNDAVLVHGLEEKITASPGDAVFVLHMMGSHGPAYHKRYPAEFERFTPVCKSSQFSHCTSEEIVNAYDNSIVYTDHVLGELAVLLAKQDAAGRPASMIYVSDHGESLGERNIYLHGMPYALAPKVQKHVPMVVWLSPLYQAAFGVDTACLSRRSADELSHDNIFHSVLGLLDIETKAYASNLDIFAPCRKPPLNHGTTLATEPPAAP